MLRMSHADTFPAHYLVVDLEATCDDLNSIPRTEFEIIEIGAVLVDGASLRPLEEFSTFVRPVWHPFLTPFCTKLTSIRQKDVDRAPLFAQAIAQLTEFLGEREVVFASWGNYDWNQLTLEAQRNRVVLPNTCGRVNLKSELARRTNDRPRGMARALASCGLSLDGTHHRGIDDARNIARMLPFCLGRDPSGRHGPQTASGAGRGAMP
jgi:3'-5' exoribonuclease 1